MNNKIYWEQFSQTGDIGDYLNYTACAKEDQEEYLTLTEQRNDKEVVFDDKIIDCYRNGISNHAHRGI